MTQRSAVNPKLANKIQNDSSWSEEERRFLMQHLGKPSSAAPSKVVANTEANKENIPNYNPQPVLRPFLKQVRTYEKPQPAPKKQKTTHSQPPAPLKTIAPQPPPTQVSKDPKPVQAPIASNPPSAAMPRVLVPLAPSNTTETTTSTTAAHSAPSGSIAAVSSSVQAPQPRLATDSSNNQREEEVRQRLIEIREQITQLEQQREENLDTQWALFQEFDQLQQKKIELRAECQRIYNTIEYKIHTLRKEDAQLQSIDRKLSQGHE